MSKKIIGIGNAIVDVLSKTTDSLLESQNLVKGSMSLIDDKTSEELSKVDALQITPGGSVANTMATLGMLKCDSRFIGKVGEDDFGKKFIAGTEESGVKFIGKNSSNQASAKSFVMITPDAQRTMCTYLGCAPQINPSDIDENIFSGANFLYLEGYLWDSPETIKALRKSISAAKNHNIKTAFSLSDSFCVSRHKNDFIDIISNDLDILFANEDEVSELLSKKDCSNDDLLKFFSQNQKLIAVITRSDKGCTIFADGKLIDVAADKIDNVLDTTGAGDGFAAGFLYGLINDFDLTKSAYCGNHIAGKIIQKIGARFDMNQIRDIQNALV